VRSRTEPGNPVRLPRMSVRGKANASIAKASVVNVNSLTIQVSVMTWVRIDDGFPEHPKMLGLSDAAFRLHIHALCYCARALTDGFIPVSWLANGKHRKAAQSLVAAGLWHDAPDGFRIHDYLEYQPSRFDVQQTRAEAAARMKRAREVRANKLGSSAEVRITPSPPNPKKNVPKEASPPPTSTPSGAPAEALVVGPIKFMKKGEKFAFYGSRLKVPHVFHDELVSKLAGENPQEKLAKFYETINADAEINHTPIIDVFEFLRPKFVEWAANVAADDAVQKFLRAT
jgi:hypothetical protein